MATIDLDVLRRFVVLDNRKREVKKELEALSAQIAVLDGQVQEVLIAAGTNQCPLDGSTVYIQHQTWARPKNGDMDALCAALADAGHADMVRATVNLQTLSSFVRECSAAELPPDLAETLDVTTSAQVRVRKQ